MNDSDPIVDEVRRIRDAHAAKFNYDPEAIFRDIKEKEKRSGRKYVNFGEDKDEPKTPAKRKKRKRRPALTKRGKS